MNRSFLEIFQEAILKRLEHKYIPNIQIEEMAEIGLRTKGTEKQEKEANRARKEDKVTFGEFFLPQKPSRSYRSDQEQTIKLFLSLWNENQFPIYSSKKADGLNSEWHISKNKVIMYTEDGIDETSSFPKTIEEIKRIIGDHKAILLAEVELWKDKVHQPREAVAGKIHKKDPDEEGLIVNVYDVVYYDKDIHDKPYEERWEQLQKFNFPQKKEIPDIKHKWNLIPHIKNEDKGELKEETERLRKINSSEGNVAKQGNASYDLAGKRASTWIKFHNAFTFPAIVLDKIETATKGVYNIEWGILAGEKPIPEKKTRMVDGKKVIYGGKTFSTTDSPARGSSITIESETFNLIHDEKTGTFDVSAWAPRYMGKTEEKPWTIDRVVEVAKRSFCFQGKKTKEDGEIVYLSEYEFNLSEFQETVELTTEEQKELEDLGKQFLEMKKQMMEVGEGKEEQRQVGTDLNFVRDEITEFIKKKGAKRIKTQDFIFSLRKVAPYFWITSMEDLIKELKKEGLERFIITLEDINLEELKNHLLSGDKILPGLKKVDEDLSLYIYERGTEEIKDDLIYLSLDKMSAELIWRGLKTVIVLPERYAEFIGKHVHLISENLDWGEIRLHLPEEVQLDRFAENYHLHLIEEHERKERWSDTNPLYLFPFHFTSRKNPQKINIFVNSIGVIKKYSERN